MNLPNDYLVLVEILSNCYCSLFANLNQSRKPSFAWLIALPNHRHRLQGLLRHDQAQYLSTRRVASGQAEGQTFSAEDDSDGYI